MKVVFFNSDFPPRIGGIATYNYTWALHTADHPDTKSVTVVTFKQPQTACFSMHHNTIRVCAYTGVGFFKVGVKVLQNMIRNFRSDVFHATNLFPVGFWVVLWGWVFRKNTVLTFHGSDAGAKKSKVVVRKMKLWAIEHASHVIAVSEFSRKEITELLGISRKDIQVIYSAVSEPLDSDAYIPEDVAAIAQDLKLPENHFVITTVCRLVKRKGVEYFIRAFDKLRDLPNMVGVVVSEGPEFERLSALVTELSLESQVKLVGRVPNVYPYYELSKIMTLNSYYREEDGDFEGLGLVLLEAQRRGIPVIGTRSGGIPEAIDDGASGYIIPEKSPDILAEKIRLLYEDQALYQRMSQGAQQFVKQKFDGRTTISEYLEFVSSK